MTHDGAVRLRPVRLECGIQLVYRPTYVVGYMYIENRLAPYLPERNYCASRGFRVGVCLNFLEMLIRLLFTPNRKQERRCTYNVTLRRFRETVVAMEKQ